MVETRTESEKKLFAEVLFENLLKSTLKNDMWAAHLIFSTFGKSYGNLNQVYRQIVNLNSDLTKPTIHRNDKIF